MQPSRRHTTELTTKSFRRPWQQNLSVEEWKVHIGWIWWKHVCGAVDGSFGSVGWGVKEWCWQRTCTQQTLLNNAPLTNPAQPIATKCGGEWPFYIGGRQMWVLLPKSSPLWQSHAISWQVPASVWACPAAGLFKLSPGHQSLEFLHEQPGRSWIIELQNAWRIKQGMVLALPPPPPPVVLVFQLSKRQEISHRT